MHASGSTHGRLLEHGPPSPDGRNMPQSPVSRSQICSEGHCALSVQFAHVPFTHTRPPQSLGLAQVPMSSQAPVVALHRRPAAHPQSVQQFSPGSQRWSPQRDVVPPTQIGPTTSSA